LREVWQRCFSSHNILSERHFDEEWVLRIMMTLYTFPFRLTFLLLIPLFIYAYNLNRSALYENGQLQHNDQNEGWWIARVWSMIIDMAMDDIMDLLVDRYLHFPTSPPSQLIFIVPSQCL